MSWEYRTPEPEGPMWEYDDNGVPQVVQEPEAEYARATETPLEFDKAPPCTCQNEMEQDYEHCPGCFGCIHAERDNLKRCPLCGEEL